MDLFGTFGGIVENVNDPEKLGRVKVRVPHVYGINGSGAGFIGTNDLPWALPAGMPAGGSAASGGFSHLPEPGDHVWVRFLDGEPEKPIWEWGMQTQADAKALKLHQYKEVSGKVGKPKRSGWTRYGHTIELNADSVLMTSSQGYRANFIDGDSGANNGSLQVATPGGNSLELDDDSGDWTCFVVEDFNLNVGDSLIAMARSVDLDITDGLRATFGTDVDVTVGGDADITVEGAVTVKTTGALNLTSIAQLKLEFAQLKLGATATEPFVLGNQLSTFLTALLIYLDTHTHSNGNNGSPTGPPLIPTVGVVQPLPALLLSSTITGQ